MGYETTVKFVKAHLGTTTGGNNGGVLYWMKLVYEFWGFCVNGTNDLRSPGGFATISGSLAPNYLRMATGFETGSSMLIASGSDGSTTYGNQVFTAASVNWTSGTMVGRHLVAWQSGSTSLDDSIYQIVRVLDSSSILVNTNQGATAMSGSRNEPRFTSRTGINFRVINFAAASALPGFATDDYMILQFNAPAINTGSSYSQARIRLRTGGSAIDQGNISLSASGSWNGTVFTDLGPESSPDGSNTDEGGSPYGFFSWAISGDSAFNLWGDQGGLIAHSRSSADSSTRNFFHVEVPRRLFPQSKDPNPICFVNVGKQPPSTSNFAQNENYSAGWVVHCPLDNVVVRRHHALARNLGGTANSDLFANQNMHNVPGRFRNSFYNRGSRKFVILDLILSHRLSTNSYTMGRCQLRLATFVPGPTQVNTKLGSRGQWIAIHEGVLWPWDNSQLPNSIFPFGI